MAKPEEQIQRDFYAIFTRGMYVGRRMPIYEDLDEYSKKRIFGMASYHEYVVKVRVRELFESLGLFKLMDWLERKLNDIANVWWYMWNRF